MIDKKIIVSVILVVLSCVSCKPSSKQNISETKSPTPTTVYRISGDVQAPELISQVNIEYPEEAKNRFVSGIGVFESVISEEGNVTNIKPTVLPHFDPPWPQYVDVVEKAISQWKYHPAHLNGKPVAVYLTITVHFVYK